MSHARRRHAMLLAAAAFGLPNVLYAREAYLVAGSTSVWTEIQGANGPILAPTSSFSSPSLALGVTDDGIATDGTNAYFLVTTTNAPNHTTSDAIWTYDLATGTRTATTPIQPPAGDPGLSDLAFLNGTLYVASGPTSSTANGTTRVYSVGPAGTLTSVYSRTDPTAATPQIAASSQSNRVVLLPVGGRAANTARNTAQVLLDPSTWSVTQSVVGIFTGGQISLNLDGSRLAAYSSSGALSSAGTYAVPGFTPVSPAPRPFGQAGPAIASVISDAFDYAYPASAPAVVRLAGQGGAAPLFRTGQHSWETAVSIGNYAVPDATTVDQVAAASLTWTQTAGPTASAATTLSPAGPIAVGSTVASTTFTVDATGAARGAYAVNGTLALHGHYTGPGTDEDRPLSVGNALIGAAFAVDPVSANYVGNGDLELGSYGWTGGTIHDSDTQSLALSFFSAASRAAGHAQSLELGTPQGPMVLSFDYHTHQALGGDANLTVTLAGIQIAFIPSIAPSSAVQHFSVYLSDPQLQGLSDPLLDFQAITSGGTSSQLYVDNISLIAVPEPAALSITSLATLPLLLRRRSSRAIPL